MDIGRHRTTRVSVAASRDDAVEPSLGLISTHLAVIPAGVQNDLSAAGALKPSDEVPRALAAVRPMRVAAALVTRLGGGRFRGAVSVDETRE